MAQVTFQLRPEEIDVFEDLFVAYSDMIFKRDGRYPTKTECFKTAIKNYLEFLTVVKERGTGEFRCLGLGLTEEVK
jgi:hypothetical protein